MDHLPSVLRLGRSSASSSSASPQLPKPTIPLSAVPYLLPWRLLVVLLASAPAEILALHPSLEPLQTPPDEPASEPFWVLWLEKWHAIFSPFVWTNLRQDDLADRQALERLEVWLQRFCRAASPSEVTTAIKSVGELKYRILERWFSMARAKLTSALTTTSDTHSGCPRFVGDGINESVDLPPASWSDQVWPFYHPYPFLIRPGLRHVGPGHPHDPYVLPGPMQPRSAELAISIFGRIPDGDLPPVFAPPAHPLPFLAQSTSTNDHQLRQPRDEEVVVQGLQRVSLTRGSHSREFAEGMKGRQR
ncbi:hypothetical protein JCM10207_002594 [Rhodosporidiobolus poonsookiae]